MEKGHYYEHVNLDTSSLLLNLLAFGPRGVDKLSDDDKTNILKIVDGRLAELTMHSPGNRRARSIHSASASKGSKRARYFFLPEHFLKEPCQMKHAQTSSQAIQSIPSLQSVSKFGCKPTPRLLSTSSARASHCFKAYAQAPAPWQQEVTVPKKIPHFSGSMPAFACVNQCYNRINRHQ